jgi:hypothetical protein
MMVSGSYNYFNGDEHLIASLRTHRAGLEHISIVWQEISNAGEPIAPQARDALSEAVDTGLVDEAIRYEPDFRVSRKANETRKRAIGLATARRAGATHFLSLDADEFYRPGELANARQQIALNGWRSTSVETFLHVVRPIWRAADVTRCCFITEIGNDTEIGVQHFPTPHVDPSRRMTAEPSTHHHFPKDMVSMYHMNLVRRDLAQKLRNSSTVDVDFLSRVALAVAEWSPGQPLDFPGKGVLDVTTAENEFATFDPG